MKLQAKTNTKNALVVVTVLVSGSFAWASQPDFDAINSHSIGRDAVDYRKKMGTNLQTDVAFVDGNYRTRPLEVINYDRTVMNYTRFWGSLVLNQRLGFRYSLWNKAAYRKEHSTDVSGNKSEETWNESNVGFDLLIHGQGGIELTGGLRYHYVAPHTYVAKNASAEITTTYSEVAIPVPHFALTNRASSHSVGFFYTMSAQRDRDVTKTTAQDPLNTLIFTEPIHFPNTIAIFLQKKMGSKDFFFEGAMVRGSGGGPKSPEGDGIVADHFRARFGIFVPLGGQAIEPTLTYRGHSYAQDKNLNLTNIAMTTLNLKFVLGSQYSQGFVGLIGGYGEAGQSSEEFDTLYKVWVFGGSAGFKL